jgi:hypothetical protein
MCQVGLAGICSILRNRLGAKEAQRPKLRYWKLSLRLLAELAVPPQAVSVVQVPLVVRHRRAYRHLERVRMFLEA